MYKGKKILGMIPARGGSKGLKRKNVKHLLGKPLIAWTIEQALLSKYLDVVVLSTEDEEISSIARSYGADIPFMRPAELASDDTSGVDVALHALDELEKFGHAYDVIVDLQPTSPLRVVDDIDNAVEMLFSKVSAGAIVSVSPAEHHPYLANTLPVDGGMRDFLRKDLRNRNRQNLPEFYRTNGAIFAAFCDYLKETGDFFGDGSYAYIMPIERSVDVDSILDFYLAESILKRRQEMHENTVSSL
jgi:N-acylneuraminate cytidylyltransferase/CMP-N,N'-diacetyllegionaminic acid synthase